MRSLLDNPKSIKYVEQTPENCCTALYANAKAIKYIENPTWKMIVYALIKNPDLIEKINRLWLTEKVCTEVLRHKPMSMLPYISNPSEELICLVLARYGKDIVYVKNKTTKHWLLALSDSPHLIGNVEQTEELCWTAIKVDPSVISYIKDLTPEMAEYAVRRNGYLIKYVEQTDELVQLAIKTTPRAITFVDDQTEELCWKAIKADPFALRGIKEQTEEMCLEAVKANGTTLIFAKHRTEEICMCALKTDGCVIGHISPQTLELCLAAVKQNPFAIKFVSNQFKEECLSVIDNELILTGRKVTMEDVEQNPWAMLLDNDLFVNIDLIITEPKILAYIGGKCNTRKMVDACRIYPEILTYSSDDFSQVILSHL